METSLDELLEDIITEFQIGDRENININSRFENGFSNAKVYWIELTGNSIYKGNYFLKIDNKADEYNNNQSLFCFSKVVKCIEKKQIKEYYVLLLQVAGNSSIEYQSFYSINESNIKRKAVRNMIKEMLEEAVKEKNIIKNDLSPTKIFEMQLKDKLDLKGVLFQFLSSHLNDKKSIKDILSIQIVEKTLPNAFAYAINNHAWNRKKIKNIICSIHGDLHGNNVFISNKTCEYAIIDMASFRDDGWIFFDTAYFELSLMIYNMRKESIKNWLYCIDKTAQQLWENIDFKDSKVIQEICKAEQEWIKNKINDKFSYKDELDIARLMARVLVGLNYAGKRNIQEEIRLKAYLFACCYLKYLLEMKGINSISPEIAVWKENINNEVDKSEYHRFLEFAGKFDNSQDYYLILGRKWDYLNSISMNLSKIQFSGVISFCLDKGFAETLEKKKLLRFIVPNDKNTWNYMEKNNTWWLYADGMKADPESQTKTFPKWRNKYRRFWQEFVDKIIEFNSENELLFIIDWKQFNYSDNNYILYLLEHLDSINSTPVNIAILDLDNSFQVNEQDYEKLKICIFKISIENIAEYCSQYLSEVLNDTIYVPNLLSHIGVPLDRENQLYIEQHTLLVYEQLVHRENILAESEKYNFFYGEPITWTAIEEGLYVKYKKIEEYEYDICEKLKNPNKDQILVPIQHSPGAGATILGKVICWNLKKEYPTFILQNKLDEDVYESLLRITTLSGKYLLIFLDGNYNQNDVNQFIFKLSSMRIKACILYPYRMYSNKIGTDVPNSILSTLESRDGNHFRNEYEKVMKRWKSYDEKECQRRIKNMDNLTTENNLLDFRLPFFYGMHAFEDEYLGIQEYLNDIINFMKQNEEIEKVIYYIALISYYTENRGLGFNYAKKIMNKKKGSGRELLRELQQSFRSMIYIVDSSYRICHPIVAKEILKRKFPNFSSEAYKEFCIQFIEDLKRYESNEQLSNKYSELMMNIFIKRDTESEINENDTQKKSFSQIILDVCNSNLQEQIYEKLVNVMPNNPHFRQHYGRLIISNNPTRLKEAEIQLNEAINLDSNNGIFYHSRGNLYVQYVFYQIKNNYKKLDGNELYNKLKYYVDLAISDFENSMSLEEKGNNSADLVYPYASIIQITTFFVHQLAQKTGFINNEKEFLENNTEISQWSKELISKAILYDMDTEVRYSSIRDNKFYCKTREHLTRFKWTPEELERNIKSHPTDYNYQIAYLGMVISDKNAWKKKNQQQLKQIITYCENLLKIGQYEREGILWKWFNANIHLKQPTNQTYSKMLGILETLPNEDANSTANYLRSILYFCKYMETGDEKMIDSMYNCLTICKKLAGDRKNRSVTHYYYMDKALIKKDTLPLEFDRENGYWFQATVIKIDSNQSGYLTLDKNPKLRAFFVPIHTELKRNQETNQSVKVKIGFRFDGLSAWELKKI